MRLRFLRAGLLLVPVLCGSTALADDFPPSSVPVGWLDDDPRDDYDRGPEAADRARERRLRARERARADASEDAWYDSLGGHVGVDALALRFADDGGDTAFRGEVDADAEPVGLRLRVGIGIEEFLDVEFHGVLARDGGGDGDDRLDVGVLGAYLKLKLPIGDYIRLTGLGGVAGAGFETSDTGDDRVISDEERTSLSYGAGLEVALGRRTDLVADWTRYLVEDGDERALDAFGVGIRIGYR